MKLRIFILLSLFIAKTCLANYKNLLDANKYVAALKNVKSQTGLMGRWQILKNKPLVIADTGHNEAGIKEVIKNIKNTKHEKLHFVLGMVNDKEVDKILQLLPKKAIYYFQILTLYIIFII